MTGSTMRMTSLALGALLLAGSAAARGQTVRGIVIEDGTGSPIQGVAVDARGPGGVILATSSSDSSGTFVLRLGQPAQLTLALSHPSYVPTQLLELRVEREESIVVELRMRRRSIPLQPVLVRSERDPRLAGFYERMRRATSGQFVTRSQIDRRPGARTTDLLREMRGVEILRVTGGAGRPPVYLIALRGMTGRCMPTIYIDGITVGQFPESGVDDFLKADMIHGAEVYTTAASAPPNLSPQDGCGVVAFWTQPVGEVEAFSLKRLLMGAAALGAFGVLVLLAH